MKIENIIIKNYRSLKNIEINPRNILALVGQNNSGKSNILKALQLFFESSTKYVDDECFYDHKTSNPIKILISFSNLTPWEIEQFKPWMNDKKLIIEKEVVKQGEGSYTFNNYAILKVPKIEWLQKNKINGKSITKWWKDKEELKFNGLNFLDYVGTTKPNVGDWKEAAKNFIKDHDEEIEWKEVKVSNPKGYSGVLKGSLPEFIYIPAVRDITDETKVAKTNPFGQLINSVLEKISEERKILISTKLSEIESILNRGENYERIEEIKSIETKLNKLLDEIMDCDVEIEMNMPKINDVFGGAKLYANDGIRTAIETKGHGLQRAMIFTILRAYSEFANLQTAGKKASEKSVLFAIEEPELYLHPQAQRTLMSVIREIASGKDQVIYTTHSSLFVNISFFDEICIMRKKTKQGKTFSNPTQLLIKQLKDDLKARKGVSASEMGIREQYSHVFNPMINEGFFANKVVIVEGPSEQYLLPIVADTVDYNLDKNNVSVIHADGKGQMDRLLRIFNGFKIPTFLWFDGDKNNSDSATKEKTLELLKLVDNEKSSIDEVETEVESTHAVLENNLEKTIQKEICYFDYNTLIDQATDLLGPTGKPLKNRFIATKLKKAVDSGESPHDIIPDTIINILESIKELKYENSILEKL